MQTCNSTALGGHLRCPALALQRLCPQQLAPGHSVRCLHSHRSLALRLRPCQLNPQRGIWASKTEGQQSEDMQEEELPQDDDVRTALTQT